MARTDVIVLGAGIIGTSTALQLARRGLAVALVDRRGPGEETSYGNTGIIGGAGVYPTAFPRDIAMLLRVVFKQAPQANYHLAALPRLAPWLWAYFRASSRENLEATARLMRPLMAASVAEHETLMQESGAEGYLRKDGWMSLYRTDAAREDMNRQLELGAELGVHANPVDLAGALALEPSLAPVFRHAILWPDIATVSNPLEVTRAYARQLAACGGVVLVGDARSLHRRDGRWRVETAEGPVDAEHAVVALGPWTQDVLDPLGLKLPLAVKRGYHLHFRPRGNAGLTRPVIDAEVGYVLAPMEQGVRLTTGVEFADRDAPPTPVQFTRVMPYAEKLFPLGEPVEGKPWMGRRPCFPDMLPVIGRAPGQPNLWLNYGHNHFGLTLGPVTGRLLAEMIVGAAPMVDPVPYRAERFGR
jgi:D-amino-acid dehydrogenase